MLGHDRQDPPIQESASNQLPTSTITHPFSHLKFTLPTSNLHKPVPRSICPGCSRSQKHYCSKCMIILPDCEIELPQLKYLPCRIVVVKEPIELDGKSTAVHARLLAQDFVEVVSATDFDAWLEKNYGKDWEENRKLWENDWMLYPSKDALTLEELFKSSDRPDETQMQQQLQQQTNKESILNTLFVLDTKWSVLKFLRHPFVKSIPKVVLKDKYQTHFWRYQQYDRYHLATIEAIYYFLVEYDKARFNGTYSGRYDDLMYIYVAQFELIKASYQVKPRSMKRALQWRDEFLDAKSGNAIVEKMGENVKVFESMETKRPEVEEVALTDFALFDLL